MEALAAELHRALDFRLGEIADRINEIRGRLGPRRDSGLADLLELLSEFPSWMAKLAEVEWSRNPDADDRVRLLRPLLIHTINVRDFIDGWLGSAEHEEVPLSLVAGIRRMSMASGLDERRPIICLGPANNFHTVARDIEDFVYPANLGSGRPVASTKFAILRVPRTEGTNLLWYPVVLGHELGHIAVLSNDALMNFDLGSKFDWSAAQSILDLPSGATGTPGAMELFGIATSWLTELLCDAFAVTAFGVAALSAMGEFLEVVGATDNLNDSHPPSRLRVHLMARWLPIVTSVRIEAIAQPWRELAGTPVKYSGTDWAEFLVQCFLNCSSDIFSHVQSWATPFYDTSARSEVVLEAARLLADGIPPGNTLRVGGHLTQIEGPDIVTAAWVCRVEGVATPVHRLGRKSLEILEFMTRWGEAGGSWPIPSAPADGEVPRESSHGVLSDSALRHRLFSSSSDDRLEVMPLLPDFAGGTSIDLRVGNQFIVFLRSSTPSFDPLGEEDDPRSMQRLLELPWGGTFALHPNEMVLAATLEYLVLPADLTAQVITRSSYGRLGMLSATAVQIHPHFHGCLTLELVNLGTIPIVLTPGERVAQLVVSETDPVPEGSRDKYRYPTGPEFSKVRTDLEADVLRGLR